ncbi:hypothetical protein ID144_09615 [Pseudomonas sp. JM0905a]|uniref:hypothetical protein n=1 Tax=Pseudomonas sp. JM0905a TaxID=2772484 RepID=UPI001681F283|nr:hypothetical protein [Pseudomonas sp. JM0905a]MBD2837292.1 hypothetical protein [Pseudomonas sp. JM0905a]
MFDFISLFTYFLPLYVKDVEWDGDFLIISGDGWSFVTSSAWRISKDKELLIACWDDDANELIEHLVGLEIIDLSWIFGDQPIDPSFIFSDGRKLDVFCSSSYEPWVINFPDGSIYIGNS